MHEGLPSSGSPSIIEPGFRFRLQKLKSQAAATSIETKIQVAEALPGM
ncbi:MAG TPA: hypothetical protein VKW08_22630 [Xanthobacteraceae bacterium]|nr:hypothetical protein [Xanthobacteraceae bacterium]